MRNRFSALSAEIRFLGRDTVFCWPAVHLTKSTKCRQQPGDLVTSLRETGEKILVPYPIRQPARSREFAFAVTPRANVDTFQNYFCLVLYQDWNSELCFK